MNNTLRIFFCALLVSSCTANDPVIGLTDKVFELAKIQYSAMDSCLTERQNPCIADKEGRLRTAGQGWWGSGRQRYRCGDKLRGLLFSGSSCKVFQNTPPLRMQDGVQKNY